MAKYQAWKYFEQEIVRKLKKLGLPARRNWDSQFVQKDGCDIECSPYIFQLKYGKRPNFKEAWMEARTACEEGQIPIGVIRLKEDKSTLVVMSWKDFEWFIK